MPNKLTSPASVKRSAADHETRLVVMQEMRLLEDPGQPPAIEGYAAVFDAPSEDLGGFVEYVRRGAFTKTIGEADVRATKNHDPNVVLGRTKNGTLTMSEDIHGLRVKILPPDTQAARDLMTQMRRGDIDQMSFMFDTVRDEWLVQGDAITRALIEVRLYDVAVVTYPAYPQTSAEVRSQVQQLRQSIAAPGQAAHPADADPADAQARIALMLRELEIAERS
jgi:HK97 family phage prohead protease